jgi:hypothetical protein
VFTGSFTVTKKVVRCLCAFFVRRFNQASIVVTTDERNFATCKRGYDLRSARTADGGELAVTTWVLSDTGDADSFAS